MKKAVKIAHWLPRIISILAVLFISLFALDAFDSKLTLWQQIGGFFIHLIPSFVLLVICILAWKKELIGGILFVIIGLVASPFVYKMNFNMNHSVLLSLGIIAAITLPFIIVGGLFIVSHYLKNKSLNSNTK